jgi:hypothetical protein
LQQKKRLAAATWFYADQVDPNAEFLRLLDSDTKVLIARDEYRIANCSIPRERDHISDDRRVNTLLFTDAVNEAEPNLDVLQVSRRKMLRCRSRRSPVVPIDPKEWHSRDLHAEPAESLYSFLVREGDLRSRQFPSL